MGCCYNSPRPPPLYQQIKLAALQEMHACTLQFLQVAVYDLVLVEGLDVLSFDLYYHSLLIK